MDIGQVLVGIADACETARATADAKEVKSPPIPKNFTLTERTLVKMFRENTGASILDSGGAYGRGWQRALKRDFSKRVPATYTARTYECTYGKDSGKTCLDLCIDIDLFTYLASRLEYDRAMTRQFEKFASLPANESKYDLELMEEFPKWISDKRDECVNNVWCENTCNLDNMLSGVIQFVHFDMAGDEYVLLQIHGGCDYRGGYSHPKVFRADSNGCGYFGDWNDADLFPDRGKVLDIKDALLARLNEQTSLFPAEEAEQRAEIALLGNEVYWQIGSNEYNSEGCKSFDQYPVIEIEDRSEWKHGCVCVLPDHTMLCPETGATLEVDFMR